MNTLAKLEKRFLPYCDNEYAGKEENATNCVDVADKYAIEFIEWVFKNTKEFDDLGLRYLNWELKTYEELLEIYKNQPE